MVLLLEHLGTTSTDRRVAQLKKHLTKSPTRQAPQDPEASAPREFDPEDADASNASDDEPAPRPDHEIRRVLGQGTLRLRMFFL